MFSSLNRFKPMSCRNRLMTVETQAWHQAIKSCMLTLSPVSDFEWNEIRRLGVAREIFRCLCSALYHSTAQCHGWNRQHCNNPSYPALKQNVPDCSPWCLFTKLCTQIDDVSLFLHRWLFLDHPSLCTRSCLFTCWQQLVLKTREGRFTKWWYLALVDTDV